MLLKLLLPITGKYPPPWYYESKHWRDFMRELRSERKFICECCLGRGWEGHHVTYVRVAKEKKKDIVLLCPRCHVAAHKNKIYLIFRWQLGHLLH